MTHVTIVDYGNGNANSIKSALQELGVKSIYSSRAVDITNADSIILPGVGHHGTATTALRENGLIDALNEAVVVHRKPVLGICLGMQLMTEYSEEGGCNGLAWLKGQTKRITPKDRVHFKVPHVGWNTVSAEPSSILLSGINTEDEPFYFCHSFAIKDVKQSAVTSTVRYDQNYVALFEYHNIFGVQFHPEKSQESGLKLLKNFLSFSE